ncbi:hypothetical protein HIV01_012250 [Lysobacter arenosi]|uniref:Secreted protein n=1 Tax=Lysobacter arenosi TaxID=2795387 RepID=A0ABX7R790_9GAMM|nr:hypothetical protein [Lysobacter arenosi]QSX73988.1 hypothetical protein HIV01_012250 [Lysobacter arenosi]
MSAVPQPVCIVMKSLLLPVVVAVSSLCAFSAHAKLPLINATCPGKLDVHVDQGGPVYVNGKEAKLNAVNENYYEAKDAATGTTISISINPDGSPDVSYTGKNRANGVCTIAGDTAAAPAAAAPAASSRGSNPASEKACLTAVSKQVGVASSKLSVIGSEFSQAGTSVSVSVPGADAPWSCVSDPKGSKVWNVMYTGSEGKL